MDPALIATIFGVAALVVMLWTGSATLDRDGIRRDEQPVLYWTIFLIGVGIVALVAFDGLQR